MKTFALFVVISIIFLREVAYKNVQTLTINLIIIQPSHASSAKAHVKHVYHQVYVFLVCQALIYPKFTKHA